VQGRASTTLIAGFLMADTLVASAATGCRAARSNARDRPHVAQDPAVVISTRRPHLDSEWSSPSSRRSRRR
jgi:hypothetical protein